MQFPVVQSWVQLISLLCSHTCPQAGSVCATQTHLRLIKIPSAAGKISLASEGQRSFLYQFNSWSGFIDIEILPQFPKIHEAGES